MFPSPDSPRLSGLFFTPLPAAALLLQPQPATDHERDPADLEHLVPPGLSEDAPEGFTGSKDLWREDLEGFGLWEMTSSRPLETLLM